MSQGLKKVLTSFFFIMSMFIFIIPIIYSNTLDVWVYNYRQELSDRDDLSLSMELIQWFLDHSFGIGVSCFLIILFFIITMFKRLPEIISMVLAFKVANEMGGKDD